MRQLKIACYGKQGSRKTLQISNLIREFGADKVAIVSCESGLATIESAINPNNVIECDSYEDMQKAWGRINKEFNTPDHWICLDGMSRVMTWVANRHLSGADEVFDRLAMGERETDLDDRLKPYLRFLTERGKIDTIKIYGRIGRDSENLLNGWLKLNCNLYATYLEDMTEQDGAKKMPPWGPHVPGQVGLNAVMSSFDYIMRLSYDREGRLVAGLNPASKLYLAKTRDDRALTGRALPSDIVDFDLGRFVTETLRGTK